MRKIFYGNYIMSDIYKLLINDLKFIIDEYLKYSNLFIKNDAKNLFQNFYIPPFTNDCEENFINSTEWKHDIQFYLKNRKIYQSIYN